MRYTRRRRRRGNDKTNENVYQQKNPKMTTLVFIIYMYIHISTGRRYARACVCVRVCVCFIERPGVRCENVQKSQSAFSSRLFRFRSLQALFTVRLLRRWICRLLSAGEKVVMSISCSLFRERRKQALRVSAVHTKITRI